MLMPHTTMNKAMAIPKQQLQLICYTCSDIQYNNNVQYQTIGSAHENNPSTSHKHNIPSNSLKFHKGDGNGGFATLDISSNGMVITHYDGNGQELFVSPSSPSRN